MKLNEEREYLDLLESIITHGEKRLDRTGVGTYALYGVTLEYDISDNRIRRDNLQSNRKQVAPSKIGRASCRERV